VAFSIIPKGALTMSKLQAVWESYKSLLRAGHINEWGNLWSDNCVFEVAYPRGGVPEEKRDKQATLSLFSPNPGERIEIDFKNDLVHVTTDPNVGFITFDFNAKIESSGYQYKNRIVIKITLEKEGNEQEGKIKELIEYADPIARQCFFQALGV
jgi:ketosteroid isomerase-like protein